MARVSDSCCIDSQLSSRDLGVNCKRYARCNFRDSEFQNEGKQDFIFVSGSFEESTPPKHSNLTHEKKETNQ
jgi:hypothetical protein